MNCSVIIDNICVCGGSLLFSVSMYASVAQRIITGRKAFYCLWMLESTLLLLISHFEDVHYLCPYPCIIILFV